MIHVIVCFPADIKTFGALERHTTQISHHNPNHQKPEPALQEVLPGSLCRLWDFKLQQQVAQLHEATWAYAQVPAAGTAVLQPTLIH